MDPMYSTCMQLKPRTGSDQAFPADWFNNLVSFLGRLVAQSPTLEPYAVFAYLSQSLRYEGPALEVMLAGAIFDNSLSALSDFFQKIYPKSQFLVLGVWGGGFLGMSCVHA